MRWRRDSQPTPVFLPGESQGRGSLVGCHLWGHTESDTTEVTQQQQQQQVFNNDLSMREWTDEWVNKQNKYYSQIISKCPSTWQKRIRKKLWRMKVFPRKSMIRGGNDQEGGIRNRTEITKEVWMRRLFSRYWHQRSKVLEAGISLSYTEKSEEIHSQPQEMECVS